MNALETDIKQLIIDTLDLEGLSPDDIRSDAPLFNEGLGLDSIDALELGLAIRKRYAVRIDAEQDNVAEIFASPLALATFVQSAMAMAQTPGDSQ